MTIKDIEEIIERFEAEYGITGRSGFKQALAIKIRTEIEALIKECVPNKSEKPKRKCHNAEMHLFGKCFDCERASGFNACREQFIQNCRDRGINI